MNNVHHIIRRVLARHAGVRASSVHPWQRLEDDLDLTQRELGLVGLEIEDAVDVELPAEGFAPLETVDDLFVFVARSVAEERRQQVLARVA
jgi:hypothetical protein